MNLDELNDYRANVESLTTEEQQEQFENIFNLFLDNDAFVEAVTFLTEYIPYITETSKFVHSLESLYPIFTEEKYLQNYVQHFVKNHQTDDLTNLYQQLINSKYRQYYSLSTFRNIFTNIMEQNRLEENFFVGFGTETTEEVDVDQIKSLIAEIDENIQVNDLDEYFHAQPEKYLELINKANYLKMFNHALTLINFSGQIFAEDSPYYSMTHSIKSYVESMIDNLQSNHNHDQKDIAKVMSESIWELYVKENIDFGLFHDAFYAIKAYQMITDDVHAFEKYEQMAQTGLDYPNVPKGNSNFAIAIRHSQVFKNYEAAIKYFYKSLEEEDKERVIKNMAPLLIKTDQFTALEDLLVDYKDYITDKKWLHQELFQNYRNQDRTGELITFIHQKTKLLLGNHNILNDHTMMMFFNTMVDLYMFDDALNILRFINDDLLQRTNFAKNVLKLAHYFAEENATLNNALGIIEENFATESLNELKERMEVEESSQFNDVESVLLLIKIFADNHLSEQGLFLIKTLKAHHPPEYYHHLLDNLEEGFLQMAATATETEKELDETVEAIDTAKQNVYLLIANDQSSDLIKFAKTLDKDYPSNEDIQNLIKRIQSISKQTISPQEKLFYKGNTIINLLGDHGKAKVFLEQSLQKEANKERTIKVLFQSYINLGEYDQALKMLKEHSRTIRNKKWLDDSLILAYEKLGQYDEALALLKIQLSKEFNRDKKLICYHSIGRLYLLNKNIDQALSYAEKILYQDELDSM